MAKSSIFVYCTSTEKAALQAAAAREKRSLSSFMLVAGLIRAKDPCKIAPEGEGGSKP
ncbi:MAG: hypothetical protein WAW37_05165 [Syntrophobacteraceae bacterium]